MKKDGVVLRQGRTSSKLDFTPWKLKKYVG